jgi:hypothetical protein
LNKPISKSEIDSKPSLKGLKADKQKLLEVLGLDAYIPIEPKDEWIDRKIDWNVSTSKGRICYDQAMITNERGLMVEFFNLEVILFVSMDLKTVCKVS